MKIGIGIISWKRHYYLKQLIQSLKKNNFEDTEFHLFQDNNVCKFTKNVVAEKKEIYESINAFVRSNLPGKTVHIQDHNVSIAINQFEAMEYLSSHYERFIFLENDIIVSENFIPLMKGLLEQFKDEEEVACISPGFRLLCKSEDVEKYKDRITYSEGHFWVEGFWAERWKRIKGHYLRYYNLVKDKPYKQRPEAEIKALFASTGIKRHTTSQDNGKDWAIIKSGMKRLRLVVNRATGIGDYGFHSTPKTMAKYRDGHNKVYDFSEVQKFGTMKLPKKKLNVPVN